MPQSKMVIYGADRVSVMTPFDKIVSVNKTSKQLVLITTSGRYTFALSSEKLNDGLKKGEKSWRRSCPDLSNTQDTSDSDLGETGINNLNFERLESKISELSRRIDDGAQDCLKLGEIVKDMGQSILTLGRESVSSKGKDTSVEARAQEITKFVTELKTQCDAKINSVSSETNKLRDRLNRMETESNERRQQFEDLKNQFEPTRTKKNFDVMNQNLVALALELKRVDKIKEDLDELSVTCDDVFKNLPKELNMFKGKLREFGESIEALKRKR